MAITFKGERTVAELNNNLVGFVKDSAFRIYDHGTLLKGNVPVKHGDFVSWTGTQWKIEPSLEYATSADIEAVAQAVAEASEIHDGGSKTESDLVEGVLTIASTNSVTKLTLTTAETLTVLANEDVPNFALEIDNTGNSNDVTVTVKDSTGTTTLKASAAGGNTIDDGAYVQLTCVGGCWTMAVFS